MISDRLLAQFWFTVLIEESEYQKKNPLLVEITTDNDMMQPRNRQKLQSKTHQHDRLIYVRQGATYSKLTCSLPGCSHSCFRTCSQASHSAPTSWTKIVAHTHKHRETKQSKTKQNKQTDGSGEVANKQQKLKTKRLKNDALEKPKESYGARFVL
jgi:hypothetical protein